MNSRTYMHILTLAAAGLLLALALAACGAAPQATATDPANVVQSFYTLINANKVDEAMRLTADDYVMNDPFGTYDRVGATKQWQSVVDAGLTFEQTNFKNTDGRVTSCYLVREKGTQIDQGCNNVTHVRQGKIIFDGLEQAERIWVVQRYYALINKGDIDNAAAFIADDALFINPTGRYQSKAEIVASLRGQAKDGLTFELSNFREKDGRVVYDYIVKAGSDALDKGTDGLTKIKDGKIIFDGTEKTESAQ
jgi:ketosteroid isomerase-like protein